MCNCINIAVIFAGKHAFKNIIPAVEKSAYFNIVGLYTRSNKDHCLNYKEYLHYSDAFRDDSVDCVYISSPNSEHFKHCFEALEHKKHVICEKPLVTKYEDFVRLTHKSKLVDRYFFEAFMFEHHEQFIKLREVLSNQRIITLTARFGYPSLDKDDIRYQDQLDGGAHFDASCYLVRACSILLGSEYKNINTTLHYEDGYSVDIGGNCVVRYKSNQTAFLDWGIGRSYRNELDVWTSEYRVFVDRCFSKGEDVETFIKLTPSSGPEKIIAIAPMNHFVRMFDSFYGLITGEESRKKYFSRVGYYQKLFFLTRTKPH